MDEKPLYTQSQLVLLIAKAERLGYYDDVVYFQTELNKLQNKAAAL